MPEASGQADGHKRATWVGLRTLRQRPRLVDHGLNGEPIFEIRSARLILRDNADHFIRLAQCSKCGREVPGAPVLTPADLARPSHSLICQDCVRTASGPPSRTAPAPGDDPAPDGPRLPEVETGDAGPAVLGSDEERIALLENQHVAVLGLLTDLAESQRSESTHRREADEAMQSELRAALLQGLDNVRSAAAPSAAESDLSAVVALEARVRESFAGVAGLVQSQRGDLEVLAATLAETRTELQRVAESTRELAVAQGDVNRRLDEITTWISAQPTSTELLEAFRGEVTKAESRLARSADVERSELHGALSEGLAQARLEVASLEEQLRRSEVSLAELVETQRDELRTALADSMGQESPTLVAAIQELNQARDLVHRKLDSLLESTLDTELHVQSLASSTDAGASRLHDLEQRTTESVDRLTRLIDTERRRREAAEVGYGLMGPEKMVDEQPSAAPAPTLVTGDLLDDLDRQLQEAELRLAQRVSTRDGG